MLVANCVVLTAISLDRLQSIKGLSMVICLPMLCTSPMELVISEPMDYIVADQRKRVLVTNAVAYSLGITTAYGFMSERIIEVNTESSSSCPIMQ